MIFDWVILTMGDRPDELARSLASIPAGDGTVIVVNNSAAAAADPTPQAPIRHRERDTEWLLPGENLGVPGGRHLAATRSKADVTIFLDDDAILATAAIEQQLEVAFKSSPRLAVVSFRIIDEHGDTSRRHVPRLGGRGVDRGGPVAYFLGGACAIRREAYEDVGGYWPALHYGHEELELSWRLAERSWSISYDPTVIVEHPRTSIARHARGWWLTGRNRVMIARRDLPLPIMLVHVFSWALIGVLRAGREGQGRAFCSGWLSGWTQSVARRPIGWAAVWALARAGRPPVV